MTDREPCPNCAALSFVCGIFFSAKPNLRATNLAFKLSHREFKRGNGSTKSLQDAVRLHLENTVEAK